MSSYTLSSLADFLRRRQTDILADWRDAVQTEGANPSDAFSGRMNALGGWLRHLMAVAQRQPSSLGAALAGVRQNATALRDLSSLHRLIARRAHEEQVTWGRDESELLWGSFEAAVEELRAHDDTGAHRTAGTRTPRDVFVEEAQRAVRAREEILAIVTHDLRTPLSAVMAGASLLVSMDSAGPDGVRVKQRGETIQRAALHMSRLISDLTDLAQIDAGRLAIARTMESPAGVVGEVVEALAPVVMRHGGTLHALVCADTARISLDRDRIRQVLANLVGNANKVGASEISVGAESRGTEVVFWVADNGPGIPAEDLPRMFDRYFRRRGTEYRGSGLGLPISNGIVRAHGGRMWIESTAGIGSTFYFSIPR